MKKYNLIILSHSSKNLPVSESETCENLYLQGDYFILKNDLEYYCTSQMVNAIYIDEKFVNGLIKFDSVYSENINYIPVYVLMENNWKLVGYTNHFNYINND